MSFWFNFLAAALNTLAVGLALHSLTISFWTFLSLVFIPLSTALAVISWREKI